MEKLKALILKLKRLEEQLKKIEEAKQIFKNEDRVYVEKMQRYNELQEEVSRILLEDEYTQKENNSLEQMKDRILIEYKKLCGKIAILICIVLCTFFLNLVLPFPIIITILVDIFIVMGTIDVFTNLKKLDKRSLKFHRKEELLSTKKADLVVRMIIVANELDNYYDMDQTLGMHQHMLAHLDNAEEYEAKKLSEIEFLKQHIFSAYQEMLKDQLLSEEEKTGITKLIENEVPGLISDGVRKMILVNNESDN